MPFLSWFYGGIYCVPDYYYSLPADSDLSWSNIIVLLHNESLKAAGELIESSSFANSTYITTGASLSSSDKKFGSSSLYFSGVSSAGGCRSFTNTTFGTTDFCVETFINADATQPNAYADIWKSYAPVSGSNFKAGSISLDFKNPSNTNLRVFCYNFSSSIPLLSSTTNLAGAGWKHVAVTRSGSTFRLFIDGVVVDTETFAGSVSASVQDQFIGSDPVTGGSQMKGYLDEFRITFGSARYTGNFTVPTAPFSDTSPYFSKQSLTLNATFVGTPVKVNDTTMVALGFTNSGLYPATLYRSTDAGLTWSATAQGVNAEYRVGAAGGGRVVYVAGSSSTSTKHAVSTDNGATFTHYTSLPADYYYAIAYGNGYFIAGAYSSSTVRRSTDGVTWTGIAGVLSGGSDTMSYGNGLFVSAGRIPGTTVSRSSNDGSSWSTTTVSGASPVTSCFTNGKFFIFNSGSATNGVWHSTDAITWTRITFPISVSASSAEFYGTDYIIPAYSAATGSVLLRSSDLINWVVYQGQPRCNTSSVLFGNTIVNLYISSGYAVRSNLVDLFMPHTILSLHGESIVDSSSEPKTLTNSGVSVSSAQSVFGTSSLEFDGTSDRITLAITQDFYFGAEDYTIEAWLHPTIVTGKIRHWFSMSENTTGSFAYCYFGSVNTNGSIQCHVQPTTGGGSTTITSPTGLIVANTWYHIMVCRKGNNIYMFLNGNIVATSTAWLEFPSAKTQHIAIGSIGNGYTDGSVGMWQGYIDDLRITKGVVRQIPRFDVPTSTFPDSSPADPLFASVVLSCHFDGTDGATTTTDSSSYGRTVTIANGVAGSALISTTQKQFGSASLRLANTAFGAYQIYCASSTDFNISSSDFTIEMWAREDSASSNTSLMCRRSGGTANGWVFTTIGVRAIINGVWSDNQMNWTRPSYVVWHHYALVRYGTMMLVFVDGILVATKSGVTTFGGDVAVNLCIGQADNASENKFLGYIDDVRFTKAARYLSSFTPPTMTFCDTQASP